MESLGKGRERLSQGSESTQEYILEKETFAFQLEFAKEMARRTGLPLFECIQNYTQALRSEMFDESTSFTKPLPGVSEKNVLDFVYDRYKTNVLQRREEVKKEGHLFGCFGYNASPDTAQVYIHFLNREWEPTGPLSAEKIDRRKEELRNMFTEVKQKMPYAKEVYGKSWLYHLDAYKRLFPESYTKRPEIDTDPSLWKTTSIWGQFVDSDYRLKRDLAQKFMERIKSVPTEELAYALEFPPLKVHGPIEDFYALYGIE